MAPTAPETSLILLSLGSSLILLARAFARAVVVRVSYIARLSLFPVSLP
jgi:hypothetical protein